MHFHSNRRLKYWGNEIFEGGQYPFYESLNLILVFFFYIFRQKEYESDEWGCGNWCEYMVVVTLASLLLVGALTLVLFWILYYREGFAWRENPVKQFNLHPVLMVAGYIFFSGFCKYFFSDSERCVPSWDLE